MKLSLDPSSTATGWAIWSDANELERFGVTRPKGSLTVVHRIRLMRDGISAILRECLIKEAVIEVPSAKVAARLGGKGAGLANYGMAVGAVLATCWIYLPHRSVRAVDAQQWTRGQKKRDRIVWCSARVQGYNAKNDPGGDIADAIWLGMWAWRENEVTA